MAAGRFIVVVLDSVGIGELPDAAAYGDSGSNTLKNLADAVGGLDLPNLAALGLGKIGPIQGLRSDLKARGAYGKMASKSPGKDSITGHWELMGYIAQQAQPTYPRGFPTRILERLRRETGLQFLGNIAASGTEIIDRFGAEHLRTGKPILYTSADSVMQFAAHEDVIPVPELYRLCETARNIMTGPDAAGRIIARPFLGQPGSFKRTANRKDFSLPPPADTVMDHLVREGIRVLGIGKIEDLFAGRGLTNAIHTKSNRQGLEETEKAIRGDVPGMIFTNLVDFDMLWGHRNDVQGYYGGLKEVDEFLPRLMEELEPDDVLALTADHGCDPTTPSTDHSREYVPILVLGAKIKPDVDLGIRRTFADLGATIAEYFAIRGTGVGESFWQPKRVGF
jgi:phosphopentomutase